MSAALLRCSSGRDAKHRGLGGDVRARLGIEIAEIASAAPATHDGVEDVPAAGERLNERLFRPVRRDDHVDVVLGPFRLLGRRGRAQGRRSSTLRSALRVGSPSPASRSCSSSRFTAGT
jgi:hypothetical protein